MKNSILYASIAATLGLAGCAQNLDISPEITNKKLVPVEQVKMLPKRGTTYVREISIEEQLAEQKITRTARQISLMDAMSQAFPNHEFIPTSPDVDMSRELNVRARVMNGADFIRYLEAITGYEMKVNSNVIFISSYTTKEWNLSAFAVSRGIDNRSYSKQSGSTNRTSESAEEATGSHTSVNISLNEDEWTLLMAGARDILGVEDDEENEDESENFMPASGMEGDIASDIPFDKKWERFDPYVHGIRTAGVVTAAGPAYKMKALDTYLKKSMDVAHTVFNIDIKSFDVLIDNSKKKAIEWDLLTNGTLNGNPFDLTLNKSSGVEFEPGVFSAGGNYVGGNGEVSAFINFLETYGEVEITDQPNLTTTNGIPAMVTAATEFSYVADFEQSQDAQGQISVTPEFERLRVGVSLAVTARKLDDNRIMLDIWPVISDITGEDNFTVNTAGNDFTFQTPRTSLREFSTRVITNSGEPIHLGGLISKKLRKSLKGLPVEHKGVKGVLDVPFGDVDNSFERRELVLLVTPTIVEGRR